MTLFPYAHILSGILIFIIGFCFHWLGQLLSIINWELAERLGLQEKELLKEYKVYEHAIAASDAAIGWIYGVAAIGLIFNKEWGFKLAWIPGSILIYHAINAWVWERNRRLAGQQLWSNTLRVSWCSANAFTGLLAILVAWVGHNG
jgi:hypothetical protein